MRRPGKRSGRAGGLVLLVTAAGLATLWGAAGETKHHHDLRGVIVKVEAEKNHFEIKTDAGHVVLCVIDNKTRLRRGSKKITLKEVRPGARAHCHCAALRDGRHYSQSLLLESAKKKS
ncbi:MAG: hypothetical protein ACE5HB_00650, partial [Terriglobia bacterium]